MDLKQPSAIILLLIPIIIPPYLQAKEILTAPAALGLIIGAYLPIWLYFKYESRVKDHVEKVL